MLYRRKYMSKNLKLKSIYELLNNEEDKPESFFIPSYQRGYRWAKQQVEELLEDIWEFTIKRQKQDGEFYCLQPIVVKKSKNINYKWDVLDGQQRLTTIYIILKFLDMEINIRKNFYIDNFYTINYETRIKSTDFLNSLPNNENEYEYIDFLHMKKAYEIVDNWFLKNKINKHDFSNTILKSSLEVENGIKKDIENNVRVIWYEVVDKESDILDGENKYKDDIEVFTRINMGKIPLTNAELIKALLIQGYAYQKKDELKQNKQFELASEWDYIEHSLQNDDFWYFINKEINEKATRIEFIFSLVAEKYFDENQEKLEELKKSKSIDKYYEFHIINHYLQNDNRSNKEKESIYEKLWSDVKTYFRILTEWHEDREFFHKIGFLIIYGKIDKKTLSILDLIKTYVETKTKTLFIKFLDEQIIKVFKNIDIESLKYGDDNDIRKVLLWFNISTIVKNEKSNLKFQFDRYKKQSWDIEHVRSQTDKYPQKSQKEAWIKDILGFIKNKKSEIDILNMKEQEFKQFFDAVHKEIEGDEDFTKDDIGNLTLLDSKTNRGYGNAFFSIKRNTIIENDMNGTFIPICTKNLFLKYYTDNAKKLDKWTQKDADDYKDAILKIFNELVQGNINEQQ